MFPDSVADRLLTVIVTGWLTVIGGWFRCRDLGAAAFHGDSHPDALSQGVSDHLLNRRLPLGGSPERCAVTHRRRGVGGEPARHDPGPQQRRDTHPPEHAFPAPDQVNGVPAGSSELGCHGYVI